VDGVDSARLERRIVRDFPRPGSAAEILRVLDELPDKAGYDADHLRTERIRAAIVLLANGDPARFRQAIKLARSGWRDLLVAAQLANEDWPARLDEALAPGGATHRTE
jgi:hypothetical protein